MDDDAAGGNPPKTGLARFATVLTSVRKFIVDVIVIAVVVGLVLYALIDATLNNHIVIEEIGLAPPIQELGYTGQIASLRLWDALQHVNQQVRRRTDLEEETPLLAEKNQIEITAPDTDIALSDLTGLMRGLLVPERRISGEFVCLNLDCKKEVRLLLRVFQGGEVFRIRGDAVRIDADPIALEAYFEDIGRQVLEVAHPILMAEYYNGLDNQKAKSLLAGIVREESTHKHKARAMAILGQIHQSEYDYTEATKWLTRAVTESFGLDPAMTGTRPDHARHG